MGEVIRKNAAAADIFADTRAAVTHATARGGTWQTLASQSLTGPLKLADLVEARVVAARTSAAPLIAAQSSKNQQVDDLVGRISDLIWNDVGRPAHDPQYELMFPSGIAFYTEARDDEQPARMALLADLIDSGIHPTLDPKKAKGYASEIRRAAAEFESVVDAARKPRAEVAMYERMQTVVASNCQGALVNYKRLLKIAGMSEADIHTVIRDRPTRKPAAPSPASPSPAAPAPTPA